MQIAINVRISIHRSQIIDRMLAHRTASQWLIWSICIKQQVQGWRYKNVDVALFTQIVL